MCVYTHTHTHTHTHTYKLLGLERSISSAFILHFLPERLHPTGKVVRAPCITVQTQVIYYYFYSLLKWWSLKQD